MDIKSRFQAKNSKFKDVFFARLRYFEVPRYQRPYAWEEDQILDFWNDLVEKDTKVFLGTIILIERDEKNSATVAEIVDGQQRILTITILIAAIREIANDFDPYLAQKIQEKDIQDDSRSRDLLPRVRVGESANEFFEQYIQRFPREKDFEVSTDLSKEERRIRKNYDLFLKKIREKVESKLNNEDKRSFVEDLLQKIYDILLIEIVVENEDDAYEIFETTNARGVELSVADLIKNKIFKEIRESDGKDVAKSEWADITTNIEATEHELKKFFRYFWVSKYSFVSERQLFKAFKQKVTDWEDLLIDLRKESEIYRRLWEGDKDEFLGIKHGQKIFNSLQALRIMGVTQCFVLFMVLIRHSRNIEIDYSRIFKAIEHFMFLYAVVCKKPGNALEKLYSKYAREIEYELRGERQKHRETNLQRIFDNLLNDLKQIQPSAAEYCEAIKDFEYSNRKQNILVSYFLSKINSSLDTTKEHLINFDEVNIEHILPQRPNEKEWGLKVKDIKEYVNNIGNLTLVDKRINSKAGNKNLNEKLVELRKSNLPITKDFITFFDGDCAGSWDENKIRLRQKKLADFSYHWIFVI